MVESMRFARIGAVIGAALLVLSVACSSDDDVPVGRSSLVPETSGAAVPATDIVVVGPPELTEVFAQLNTAFEGDSGTSVGYAPSDDSAGEATNGDFDLVVSADEEAIDSLHADGAITEPIPFANTRLLIAVASGNPLAIGSLKDLTRPGIRTVLGEPRTSLGRDGFTALEDAGIQVEPTALAPDAESAMALVARGEADAALVYLTDVGTTDEAVDGVGITDVDTGVSYHIAARAGSLDDGQVEFFEDYVLSDKARAILDRFSFQDPALAEDEHGHEDE